MSVPPGLEERPSALKTATSWLEEQPFGLRGAFPARELNEWPSALGFCLKRSGLQAKRSLNEVLHKRSGHFARSALSLLPSVMEISANPHKP